ncbi:MAG: hypothetical protein P8K81_00350 [Flavobacteriales bacterium]|nr:hypothetical protein [Flavobacteriales bacterium]
MSDPQHWGDLIFPSQEGHLDTCTVDPLSREIWPFSKGTWHLPHWAFTDMPHWAHSYVFII